MCNNTTTEKIPYKGLNDIMRQCLAQHLAYTKVSLWCCYYFFVLVFVLNFISPKRYIVSMIDT